MKENDSLFGDVIYSYTRKQAIEDGVLVDLSQFPITRKFFKFHTACTSTVWETIDARAIVIRIDADEMLVALYTAAIFAIRKGNGRDAIIFNCDLYGKTLEFKVHCGPGDNLEPVITIMFSNED